nr:MAG TPA: hypothetical protein [Caudoviricetes sp.]
MKPGTVYSLETYGGRLLCVGTATSTYTAVGFKLLVFPSCHRTVSPQRNPPRRIGWKVGPILCI